MAAGTERGNAVTGLAPSTRPRRTARSLASTTPGLLRLWSVATVGAMVLLWLVTFATTVVRGDAMTGVSGQAGPSLVAAERIRASLSEADASAAGAFLSGGIETQALRTRYSDSIAEATGQVIALARTDDTAGSQGHLAVLTDQIPVYTGLVETARADNRLVLVVGAAYFREASTLMRRTILPAADALVEANAGRVDRRYSTATSGYHLVAILAAGTAAISLLAGLQIVVYRRTHRILNLPVFVATVLTLTVITTTIALFLTQRSRLVDARDNAYAPMTLAAQSRVLALRVWGDESLTLIARGDSAVFDANADAQAAMRLLGYDPATARPRGPGSLTDLTAMTGGGTATGNPGALWAAYQRTYTQVLDLLNGASPSLPKATGAALGQGTSSFSAFDAAADAAQTTSERDFTAEVESGQASVAGLAAGATVALTFAALLALAGVQIRINEYR